MSKTTINRITKLMLMFFGIWPNVKGRIVFRIFWSITIIIVLLGHYLYFIAYYRSADIFDLMDCFSSFLGFFKLIIKCFFFWSHQALFNEVLTMMKEDWDDCAEGKFEMQETEHKAKISKYVANGILFLHTCGALFFSLGTILSDVDITDPTIQLLHIMKVEVPFSMNTQVTYKTVLIVELVHLIMSSWGLGLLNGLLLVLIFHVGGQINILHKWLTELVSEENKCKSVTATLKKIIRKHQKIITFAKNVDSLYTFITFIQFISNTIMICIIGFLIITALGTSGALKKIVRALALYSVTNIEAFIFCYAGEYLIGKSEGVGIAAYNATWYELEPELSRVVLFILVRSQRQLTLTVGNITDLSLQTFATIMNSAGSYLSVLLAMQ